MMNLTMIETDLNWEDCIFGCSFDGDVCALKLITIYYDVDSTCDPNKYPCPLREEGEIKIKCYSAEHVPPPAIVNGRATRKIAKGERLWLPTKEYEKIMRNTR